MSPLEPATLLVMFLVVIAAQTVETLAGFGATVITLSIGVQFLPMELLVVTLVLIGLVQSSWLVLRGRAHVRLRLLLTRILPSAAIGLAMGNLLFQYVDASLLKYVLGGFLLAFSSFRLWKLISGKESRKLPPAANVALVMGGGFFHGLFAAGGPLVVYYASRALEDRFEFRATLSALWLTLNTTLLVSFVLHDQFTRPSVTLAILLLPAVGFGILVGELVVNRVNDVLFRKVVQGLLVLTGLCLLA